MPNENGFAFWWNISFTLSLFYIEIHRFFFFFFNHDLIMFLVLQLNCFVFM